MKPLIGLSGYLEMAQWSGWREQVSLIPANYVRTVERAGGVPVVLPVQDPDAVASLLGRLDGLIVTGGVDLDPALYDAEPLPHTDQPNKPRDRFELELMRGALRMDLPTLAICRGMQLLNVALGGNLDQELDDVEYHRPHRFSFAGADHEVSVERGSQLARLLGEEQIVVKTHHHQGLGRLADGLHASAWARDGVVEAVESPAHRFLLAVQWHPEEGDDDRLVAALVAEAAPATATSA
jgi:putative glutamine amidotransferase